jgi:glucosylceramidase
MGANDYAAEWYSHNEHDGDFAMEHFSIARDHLYLLPYIREGLVYCPDMTLFASPWSPPTWMKFPKAYNNGTLVKTPENLAAYALYFRKFVEAYAAAGVKIAAVHVQNEPNSDQKFPSCVWRPEEMRDFIRDHLGPQFSAAGLNCEIWLGTIERGVDHYTSHEGFKDWAGLILDDEVARSFIKGVGYQWAGKGAVLRTHLAYPELPIVQTENACCYGKNAWFQSHYIFDLIWHFIQNGTGAYVYWNMVLEPGGRSTWAGEQNAMVTINPADGSATYNPEYYVMRHLAAQVQRGARRIELSGNWCVNALGFANPDGSTVLVLQNAATTARTLDLTLADGQVRSLTLAPESFHTLRLT